jgi:hypothetical protein
MAKPHGASTVAADVIDCVARLTALQTDAAHGGARVCGHCDVGSYGCEAHDLREHSGHKERS